MQTALKITADVKQEIVRIIDERIREAHVTKEDFSELKAIVRELAEAQKELADAQKRTDVKMGELVDAQKRTEISVGTLAKGLDATRTELGGLARSVGYSLENEAYRQLPGYLKERYGIEITEKMIRLELEGEEINIFAHGKKNTKDVLVVGEAELRLSSVGKLKQLEKKVSLVKKRYPGECIPLIITHFVRSPVLERAKEMGIIVVQSFEW
jgi:hypothetical protein